MTKRFAIACEIKMKEPSASCTEVNRASVSHDCRSGTSCEGSSLDRFMRGLTSTRGNRKPVRRFEAVLLTLGLLLVVPSRPSYAATTSTSKVVIWSCKQAACPWGPVMSNHALVWPRSMSPLRGRLGYETSAPVYLPAQKAKGIGVLIVSGRTRIFAGALHARSHRLLATLAAGQRYRIKNLKRGEVASVQSDGRFSYTVAAPGTRFTRPTAPGPSPPATPARRSRAPTQCRVR